MPLASLQARGHTLSSMLKLKMWQIGVAILFALILSKFPSRLSDPGGLYFIHLFYTDFMEFKSTIIFFQNLVRYTWMCSVSVPKFVYLTNEKVIKVVDNSRRLIHSGFYDN